MKLSSFFKNKTIAFKLFILSALQILIPIFVIGIFSAALSSQIINKQTIHSTTLSFYHMVENIENKLNNISDASTAIAYDRDIYKALVSGAVEGETENNVKKLLENTLIRNNEIISLHLSIDAAEFSVSNGKSSIFPQDTVGYINLKRKSLDRSRTSNWHADIVDDELTNLFYATPIYDPYNGDDRGLLIMQINPQIIINYISKYNTEYGKSYAILSDDGQYVLKPTFSELYKNPNAFSFDTTSEMHLKKIDNVRYLWYSIPDVNWKLIYIIEQPILYRSFYSLLICIFCLCVVSAILLIFFYRYTSRDISSPLSELTEEITNWNENAEFKNLFTERTDEIGLLYSGFQKLTEKIIDLINLNYKSEIALKDTELKMLQSQINPHFLFNTLESINAMAYLYDVPKIGDMTRSLSIILSHSFRDTDKYVPLRDELNFTDNYIMIMQCRYADKFTVKKETAENTMDIPVPSLIIQPIVENSIKHGVVPSERKCTITIKSYLQGNDMVLSVTDNGIGIENQKLERIKNELSSTGESAYSVGIANTNKRLVLLFGNDYALKINSIKNRFTTVTMRFNLNSEIYKNFIRKENLSD